MVMGREGKERDNEGGERGLAFSSFSQKGGGGKAGRKETG